MKKLIVAIAVVAMFCQVQAEEFVGYYQNMGYQAEHWDAPTTGEMSSSSKRMTKAYNAAPPVYSQIVCYSPEYGVPEFCSSNTNFWYVPLQGYDYTLWDGWYLRHYTASSSVLFWNSTPVQQVAYITFTYKEVNTETGGVGPLRNQQGWFYVPRFGTAYYSFPQANYKFGQLNVQWVHQ